MQYQVQFGDKPAGTVFTTSNVGANGFDTLDSDASVTDGKTQVITLAQGENNTSIDAGVYTLASLGDRLWVDTNANGQQDDGATGLSGQTITLAGGGADGLLSTTADNTTATAVTGTDGAYRFSGLTPGVEYQVQFSKPAGYNYTGADTGSDSSDSDANASTGKSQVVKLASGEYNASVDAGVVAVASDLSITKSDGVTSVVPGQSITYTIVAKNTGSASALNALVSDAISSDLTNVTWTSVAAGGASGNLASGSGSISDYVNLTPGSTITYTVSARIGALSVLEAVADFGAGANNTNLGQNETINGIRADAYYISSGIYKTTNTVLWGRNVPSDHGLGVWSNGEADPVASGGDVNEISNQLNNEVIRLTKPAGEQWSSLWVSSLDVGGSGNAELGTLYWSNSATPDLSTLTTKFVFKYGDFGLGEEEGNILALNPPGFDASAKYVFFIAGPNAAGTNNDYLLWKAGTIPAQISNTATIAAPAGFTDANSANNSATDSDSVTIPVTPIVRGSIGDRVWEDMNFNGSQDAGEAGVAGVTVRLLDAGSNAVMASTTTNASGNYLFNNLNAGNYKVEVVKPAGYFVTKQNASADGVDSDIGSADGRTAAISLATGENNTTVDAGLYATASIGDRLWVDTNANGQQDDGATGLSGQTITLAGGGADGLLSTTADNTTATAVTGTDGAYRFSGLTPGVEYQVQFSKPAGYNYTGADTGSDSSDSDANASTGKSQVVKLASGEYNASVDAGVVAVASDLSITKSDGVTSVVPGQSITYTIVAKNTGSASALNALVSDAISSDLTNVTWTSVAAGGASGNLASGSGSISDYVNLTPGSTITYTVSARIGALSVLEAVADFGAGANNTNLGQNETINGIRADAYYISSGIYKTTNTVLWGRNVPSDHGLGVWSNGEADPVASGGDVNEISNQLNNEVIRLTKPAGEQWSSLWVSSLDVGGSGNAELGTLYWSNSATPDLSTLTTKFVFKYGDFGLGEEEGNILALNPPGFDASAKYVFFIAGPNAAGTNNDYLLWKAGTIPAQISNTATIAAPAGFTDANSANNSATDSDSVTIPVTPIVRGSIGDRVWEDMNFNGSQDAGEAGVAGVTVRLLDAGSNAVMASTTTNASGNYLFNNLNAGNYKVEVVKPAGYFVTKQNASADGVDSDIGSADGRTAAISLATGENNTTVDAGLYRKGSIGDKVWADFDKDGIQDVGEEGIAGIKVALLNAANVTIATTTTNSNGNYSFGNLDPGTYSLTFDKTSVLYKGYNLNDAAWTLKNAGSSDSLDSDVVGNASTKTNVTHTDAIVLVSGENDLTWDAAITPIVIDLNGDGIRTVSLANSTGLFDLLGNGAPIASGWLSGGDGFLAVDKDGNGRIDSIAELFGGAAKGAGFAQLAGYDSNHDGVVDARDADFASLRVWRDGNGNHLTDAGELVSLAQAGVLSLQVAHTDLPFLDAQGNLHLERSAATLANGVTVDMTDVYLAISANDAPAKLPTLAQLMEEAAQPVADAFIELTGCRNGHCVDGGLSAAMYA